MHRFADVETGRLVATKGFDKIQMEAFRQNGVAT